MSSNGYIRVHRKMRDNWIMQDGQTLQVWMYLLMCASHKSHSTMVNGEVVKLMQGELIFGRRKCAEFLGLGEQKVRTSITRLEKAGNLTKRLTGRSTKSASVISITNWGAYQNNATPSNQQNNQETNRQLTKSQPRANQELTTIQEGLKGLKEKKEPNPCALRFEEFWKLYPKKKNKGTAEKAWESKKLWNGCFDSVMSGLSDAITSDDWKKEGGKFIPYPATWLNAKGWEDEVLSPSSIDPFAGAV